MNPILLQKQLRDNSKDLQDFYKELQEWGDEMKRKNEPCVSDAEAPPLKSKVQKTEHTKNAEGDATNPETKKSKRIKSCDYKSWEKFDADAYCKGMDKEAVGEPLSDDASDDLSDEFDGSMVDMANCEKEKGNAFVKKHRWDDAIKCYTKAIECYAYDPIFYANRALCHLKKQNYRNAESDCTAALQLDKKYVKAYQRRAAARESLNQLNEARDDLLRVLELEKKNVESKAALVKLEKKIEQPKQPVAEPPRPVSKFTLSRQRQKPPPAPEVIRSEIPAVKAHVIERLEPTNMNLPTKSERWPGGTQVELFASLSRPRKARSVKPLKRIEIIDVDLQTELQEDNRLMQGESESKMRTCEEETTLKLMEHTQLPPKNEIIHVDSQTESQGNNRLTQGVLELDESESKMQSTVKKCEEETLKLMEHTQSPPKNEIIHVDSQTESQGNMRLTQSVLELNESESKMQSTVKRREEETLKLMELIPLSNKSIFMLPKNETKDAVVQKNVGDVQIPRTSVQFYKGWKSVGADQDFRLRYMIQINPKELPNIFKESLESKVFSEMIETLNAAQDRSLIYDWLTHLMSVKRFSTLTMFMSAADKKRVAELFAYLKEDNKFEGVGELCKKYEV